MVQEPNQYSYNGHLQAKVPNHIVDVHPFHSNKCVHHTYVQYVDLDDTAEKITLFPTSRLDHHTRDESTQTEDKENSSNIEFSILPIKMQQFKT